MEYPQQIRIIFFREYFNRRFSIYDRFRLGEIANELPPSVELIYSTDILWDETLLRHQDYDFVVRYCKKYRMCPKMEATTIYYYSQVPKTMDFDSCIRFISSVEHEISDHVYMNYHLQMLHQAVARSADEAIIQYYRKAATRYEYLLSLYDYLMLRKPQNRIEALKMKMKYLWNILCTPMLIQD